MEGLYTKVPNYFRVLGVKASKGGWTKGKVKETKRADYRFTHFLFCRREFSPNLYNVDKALLPYLQLWGVDFSPPVWPPKDSFPEMFYLEWALFLTSNGHSVGTGENLK